ncbi:hypothetical protein TWF506_007278 [Arthrobotrys conoides]|uniref:Uncharacterized protein n=1 Tax=Arthrobotrys conoides TaxID=74498 RepID=A0AAN8RZH0_9PEZI
MAVISRMEIVNRLPQPLSLHYLQTCCGYKFPEELSTDEETTLCATSDDKCIYTIGGLDNHIIVIDIEDFDQRGKVEIFSVDRTKTDILEQDSKDAKKLLAWDNREPIEGLEVSENYKAEYITRTKVWAVSVK